MAVITNRQPNRSINDKVLGARAVVGMLALENMPKTVLVTEALLPDMYEKGLTEYQTFCELAGKKFEPEGDFRQLVLDDMTRYLERKGMFV